MVKQPNEIRQSAIIAFVAMVVLFLGAVVFFRERLFADTSFMCFGVINSKHLAIQHYRYGSFITQAIPYFGQALQMPLPAIVFAYSISFSLFFLIVSAVIIFRFRQYELSLIFALFFLLFVSDSYFLECGELLQGVAWLFLGLAIILKCNKHQGKFSSLFFLYVAFIVLALTSHFIVIISFLYLLVYFLLDKDTWNFSTTRSALITGIPLSVMIIKLLIPHSGYDDAILHNATHFSIQDIIDSFSKPVVLVFLERCVTNYWISVFLLVVSVIVLIRNNRKKQLLWTILSIVGYIVLMGLTYRNEDRNTVLAHIELEWQSLGVMIATPFVFEVLPKLKYLTAILLLIMVMSVRLTYIAFSSTKFTDRKHFNELILSKMKQKGITKLVLVSERKYDSRFILDWAIPFESMFVSASMREGTLRTYCILNPDGDKDKIGQLALRKDVFYDSYALMPVSALNRQYFMIDTLSPYRVMSYDELLK